MRERLAVYEELDMYSNETLSAVHARRARFGCRLVMEVISPAYGHVPRNTKKPGAVCCARPGDSNKWAILDSNQ